MSPYVTIPVRFITVQYVPVPYILAVLHPCTFNPGSAGSVLSLKRHSDTESVFVMALNLLIVQTFGPCFFHIYFSSHNTQNCINP
jgi:hypothetical protein